MLDTVWSAVAGALGAAKSWEDSLSVNVPSVNVVTDVTLLDSTASFPAVHIDLPIGVQGCSAVLTLASSVLCPRPCGARAPLPPPLTAAVMLSGCNECKIAVTGGQLNMLAEMFDPSFSAVVPDPTVALVATADITLDFNLHIELDILLTCAADVHLPNISSHKLPKSHKKPAFELPIGCVVPLCVGIEVLGQIATAGLAFTLPVSISVVR